ncbi:hypothetical protein Clacol_010207 [Clathrus columnatus]|uniref:Uncharacterized protein n=1 Tax=Clathrus columnatus TaxID=1419009 RepID=A0AAV5ATG0_9AGAM|nr:hypothetical protein Clacol_010207 [Clathrus columnatus]
MSFEYGPYEIRNVKNGSIDTQGEFPHTMPVVASPVPQGAIWGVVPPKTPSEPGIIEVNIFKQGQPANVYRDEDHEDDHLPGIVAIQLSENRNVWRLHNVVGDVYLIYYSRQGELANPDPSLPSRLGHWRLPSSLEGTKVVVETDEDHPVNELLKPYLAEEILLEEFEIKLNELYKHVPECFWEFKKQQ